MIVMCVSIMCCRCDFLVLVLSLIALCLEVDPAYHSLAVVRPIKLIRSQPLRIIMPSLTYSVHVPAIHVQCQCGLELACTVTQVETLICMCDLNSAS